MNLQTIESIRSMVEDRKHKWTFTLEHGRGETYNHGKPVLYGHSVYPRGSVLAGKELRRFVTEWPTPEAALKDLAELPKFKYENMLEGGTTHIPVEQMVSHLPDDTDY